MRRQKSSTGASGTPFSVCILILARIADYVLTTPLPAFGLMSAARGIDEGLEGTTASLSSFSRLFHLDDPAITKDQQANRLSHIAGMVQLGSFGEVLVFHFP